MTEAGLGLQPQGEPWVGVVVPAAILTVSIAVSLLLYKRFVRGDR